MKITGINLGRGYVETVVIPRAGQNIVFKAEAVLSFKQFEELCPAPIPRKGMRKNKATGVTEEFTDTTNEKYLTAVNEWAIQRTNWMIIESLKASKELTWDTVVDTDPTTWGNYATELEEAGFSDMQVGKIIDAVVLASGLDETKITEATNSFLASAVEEVARQSTPSSELQNTVSGEPAKD